ncbi:hypothetical protein LOAG_14602, partial [Loa loa]
MTEVNDAEIMTEVNDAEIMTEVNDAGIMTEVNDAEIMTEVNNTKAIAEGRTSIHSTSPSLATRPTALSLSAQFITIKIAMSRGRKEQKGGGLIRSGDPTIWKPICISFPAQLK